MSEGASIELIPKLRYSGNSFIVTVPKDWIEYQKLKKGDRVRVHIAPKAYAFINDFSWCLDVEHNATVS